MTPLPSTASPDRDWVELRSNLNRATQVNAEEFGISPEQAQAILVERARRLARVPPELAGEAGKFLTVAVFTLGGSRLGLETRLIREVLRAPDFTPVPGATGTLRGLINLRGQVLPVFDVGMLLGLPAPSEGASLWVLVLGEDRTDFGILAEAVLEVAQVPAAQIGPTLAVANHIDRAFLAGVTEDALVLLAGDALLQDPRLVIDQRDESDSILAEATP